MQQLISWCDNTSRYLTEHKFNSRETETNKLRYEFGATSFKQDDYNYL